MSANLSVIWNYVDSDVHIWTEYSLFKNKRSCTISLQIQTISFVKLKFDCLVGSNNSPNHLDSGLVPVQVSQEDVGVVRVLCVWKFIQTTLWGFEPLESCHFYLFQLFLSAVCNCRLPIMLFTQEDFFLSSSPSFPLTELPPSYYFRDDIRFLCPCHTRQSEDCFFLVFFFR